MRITWAKRHTTIRGHPISAPWGHATKAAIMALVVFPPNVHPYPSPFQKEKLKMSHKDALRIFLLHPIHPPLCCLMTSFEVTDAKVGTLRNNHYKLFTLWYHTWLLLPSSRTRSLGRLGGFEWTAIELVPNCSHSKGMQLYCILTH